MNIDALISFLSQNPNFSPQSKITFKSYYYHYTFQTTWRNYPVSLIDFSCFYGSLKCFKYLLLNKCEVT